MNSAGIISLLKTIQTFIVSIFTSITLLICPTPADTSTASLTSERCYTIVDAYLTGQGLESDGTYYYSSGAISAWNIGGLAVIDMETGEIVRENLFALPKEFQDKGYDHIGDIAYQDGVIYAPVEDKAEKYPLVLIYDPETLTYTGKYYELDATYLDDGIPWCAVDENYLYTSTFHNPDKIVAYNIDDMTFSHIITLSLPLDRLQAGDCLNGKLYANCDPKDGNKTVYEIDLKTGETKLLFDRNKTGYDTETEGLCVTADEEGNVVFHISDYNKLFSTILRTYTLK